MFRSVMRGLDPRIPTLLAMRHKDRDGRDKPGHDNGGICSDLREIHMRLSSLYAAMALLALMPSRALAQDIPGLEGCMAEKQMERRTGCFQSNDDFLQRSIQKLTRETQAKTTAMSRDLAAAQAEIATLKAMIEKLNGELVQLKAKAEPAAKK
jgi:hypothetical protein